MSNSNKRNVIMAAVSIVVIFIVSFSFAGASSPSPLTKADQQIDQIIREKSGMQQTKEPSNFFEERIERAQNDAQKQTLQKLEKNREYGWGDLERSALEVTGELSKDHRRLTLDDAQKVVTKNVTEEQAIQLFNEIAGAPDFHGGSGIERTLYFLDDSGSEYIEISLGSVKHIRVLNDGSKTSDRLGSLKAD